MKKLIPVILTLSILFSSIAVSAIATDDQNIAPDITPSNISQKLRDGSAATYEQISTVNLKTEAPVNSLYIVFRSTPVGFNVTCGGETARFEGGYLQYFADISESFSAEATDITVTLDETVSVCDIYALGEGQLPDFVHNWKEPYERADLLLFTSHADDEQLFFAGILPYYAGELGYRVQVAYFTDHINEPGRRHELLNGLWTVGIRHYPVISKFPDQYSETYDGALYNLKAHGFTEDDVLSYQTELLRRFKPLVAIGHDLEGEYGHGQHKLNSGTLTKAVELAKDDSNYPESAQKYGTWDTPKLYLHLYAENPIVMDWDIPLERFGGKTAFQVTQDGFDCHKSQHYTWFNTWLNGSSGTITKASQITQHSPCKYGLYRSTVGEDILKNDFFENITTYAEQERIAAEEEAKRKEEEEKKRREEEESRKAEESLRAEAEKAESTTNEPIPDTKNHLSKSETIFFVVVFVSALTAIIITFAVMSNKSKKRKRRH